MQKNKQNITEVLAFIINGVARHDLVLSPDHKEIVIKLQQAGFEQEVIYQTFDWLSNLVQQQSSFTERSTASSALRIFTVEESAKINLPARDFILTLERIGVLDTKVRETVISQLMQLDQHQIDPTDVKWVTMLVLLHQPGKGTLEQVKNFLLETTAQQV